MSDWEREERDEARARTPERPVSPSAPDKYEPWADHRDER